jgi:hypothetical protein
LRWDLGRTKDVVEMEITGVVLVLVFSKSLEACEIHGFVLELSVRHAPSLTSF